MTKAEQILANARAREAARAETRRIDYERMNQVVPKQKARLTRAVNAKDKDGVLLACHDAVTEWDEIGAWPDDWARWQRALDDVFPVFHAPRLEDLR
jgi:hypothetical protein